MIKVIKADEVNKCSLKLDPRISAIMTKAMIDRKLKEITKKFIPFLRSIVIPNASKGIQQKIKAVGRSFKQYGDPWSVMRCSEIRSTRAGVNAKGIRNSPSMNVQPVKCAI